MNRNTTIVVTVVALHVGALWAMHSGLLKRVVEWVIPAEVMIEATAPAEPEQPKPTPSPAKPVTTQSNAPATPQQAPVPLAVATPTPTPSANAPAPVVVAEPSTQTTNSPAVAAAAAPYAPPAKLVLPSKDADYLNNPSPPYPSASKRMGEQGQVVIRTLIGVDGTAQQAEIKRSSGYERLDQVSLATALRWKYVPGKRAGVAEAMWFDVPFNWELR
jgi:protein TonB